MSRSDDPRKVNIHLVFYSEDKDLLRELDAEVSRRKSEGDTKFNRNDLIKEKLLQVYEKKTRQT